MAKPPALVGKKRADALKMLAGGASAREVGRKFGVDHKTISKMGRETATAGRQSVPKGPPPKPAAPPETPPEFDEIDFVRVLDDDIRLRMQIRDGLLQDFKESTEPRERGLLAAELNRCLDGLRKAVTLATAPKAEVEGDDEAERFDAYFMQTLSKARVAVDAATGPDVPCEEEPAGEVGARTGTEGAIG